MRSDCRILGSMLFVERDIPYLKKAGATIIVNVCGKSEKDYLEVVERLADQPVDLLEINVSCPNDERRRDCFWTGSQSVI